MWVWKMMTNIFNCRKEKIFRIEKKILIIRYFLKVNFSCLVLVRASNLSIEHLILINSMEANILWKVECMSSFHMAKWYVKYHKSLSIGYAISFFLNQIYGPYHGVYMKLINLNLQSL